MEIEGIPSRSVSIMGKQKPHFEVDKSEFERMCHITDTSSTPSRVSCWKGPFFFKPAAFQFLPRARNVQKSYYGPCKTNRSESRRLFQRFYYEKTLVGYLSTYGHNLLDSVSVALYPLFFLCPQHSTMVQVK